MLIAAFCFGNPEKSCVLCQLPSFITGRTTLAFLKQKKKPLRLDSGLRPSGKNLSYSGRVLMRTLPRYDFFNLVFLTTSCFIVCPGDVKQAKKRLSGCLKFLEIVSPNP